MPRRLLAAAALAALALALAPSLRAEGFGRSLADLRRDVARSPGDPAAELVALEAFAQWDDDPAAVRELLEAMLATQRLGPRARERVLDLLEEADLREGHPDDASARARDRGFLSSWRVLGPLGPDAAAADVSDFVADRAHDGVRGKVLWRVAPAEATAFGTLRLDALFSRHEDICALAATDFDAGKAGRGVLRLSAAGSLTALWNGARIAHDGAYRERASRDRIAAGIAVRAGRNSLVVRVCAGERGAMALAARVTDVGGARGSSRTPDGADGALYALLTGAIHPGSHRERDLAKAACASSRGARPCLIWGALALDANERRLAAEAARTREPGCPEAAIALSRVEAEAGDPVRALAALEAASKSAKSLSVDLARLEILASRGFPLEALRRLGQLGVRDRRAPSFWIAASRLAERAGVDAERLRCDAKTTEARFDLAAPHLSLARAAAARGDGKTFETELRAAVAGAPYERERLFAVGAAFERAARFAEAEAILKRLLALDPEDAEATKRLGLLAIRKGERDEGLRLLGEASRRDPGDTWLAGYLDAVAPSARFEDPFVVPPEEFLAWRGGPGGGATYLVDSQVVHVEPSGLASRFHQLVIEVRGDHSAREQRTHTVEYAPSAQRVKILAARVFRRNGEVESATGRATAPIAEPWYRLYYDLEAELVELPALLPGDVVEYRYRVDDTRVMRFAEGYFGDFTYAVDTHLKKLWRYALIAPTATVIEIAEPELRGLQRTSSEANGETTRVFEARDVPALAAEPAMHGESAGRAYLHLSTFRTFEELGRWYEDLIRDQLLADSRIRAKALELAARARTPAQKAAAIYGWVVGATRYVGLEFGVHGYKPYRAAAVMSRGFGDCKDKAALLVALLGEVGVEAELVLVRTRSQGDVGPRPASLEVFNHAIVHVPKLGLWLDGTAEHHGSRELPFEDQGALALRLTREGPVLTRTPVAAAADSSLTERLRASIDGDGRARIAATLELRGAGFAPAYRREFETSSNRDERFAAVAADRFPGSEIASASFAGLEALEGAVRVRYEATVASLGRPSGGGMLVSIDKGERLQERYASLPAREHSLEIGPRRVVSREAIVEVPNGFRVARTPERTRIETEFGSLELDASGSDGSVRVTRRFELDAHEVAPEAYQRFAAFCRDVDQALAAPIVFERSP